MMVMAQTVGQSEVGRVLVEVQINQSDLIQTYGMLQGVMA